MMEWINWVMISESVDESIELNPLMNPLLGMHGRHRARPLLSANHTPIAMCTLQGNLPGRLGGRLAGPSHIRVPIYFGCTFCILYSMYHIFHIVGGIFLR